MKSISISEFVASLSRLPAEAFSVGAVYDYLQGHCVDKATLKPYLFFQTEHYTRNLIFKNDLFELMAICWDIGQASSIHNHSRQNCWMAVPMGKLRVQNFRVVEQNESVGLCRLARTDAFDIHQQSPAEVDPTEPVHQVLNLSEFNERAVSLHIYSKPYDRCLVYSLEEHGYKEVKLTYTSEYGRLNGSPQNS